MKQIFALIFLALILNGCDKEEVEFEAFSPESFAFDIGDTWEVNALVNVRGFEERENGDVFSASVLYDVDLITPEGNTIESIFKDSKKISQDEEVVDIPLEVQFELDSTYTKGKYKLLFNIRDNFSEKTAEISVEFDLSD